MNKLGNMIIILMFLTQVSNTRDENRLLVEILLLVKGHGLAMRVDLWRTAYRFTSWG